MSALTTIHRTLVLPAVLFLALLVSTCSMVNYLAFAESWEDGPIKYPWSDQPEYNRSFNPSPSHDGWNSYQRQQEQMERYRQDSLNAEREYQRSLEPAPRLYNPPSTTILPNGRSMTCYLPTKGNPLNTCF